VARIVDLLDAYLALEAPAGVSAGPIRALFGVARVRNWGE
jgi:hypothetical protein